MDIEYKTKEQAIAGLRQYAIGYEPDTQVYMNVYESGFCQYVALTIDFKLFVSHWFIITDTDIDVDTFKRDNDGFNSYFATVMLDRQNDTTYTLEYTAFTSIDDKLVLHGGSHG